MNVSSVLMKHDNYMLRYLCMEKAGDTYLDENESRITTYNYRTCIYVGEKITVIGYTGNLTDITGSVGGERLDENAISGYIKEIIDEKDECNIIAGRLRKIDDNVYISNR